MPNKKTPEMVAEELVESFGNGNLTYVVNELREYAEVDPGFGVAVAFIMRGMMGRDAGLMERLLTRDLDDED